MAVKTKATFPSFPYREEWPCEKFWLVRGIIKVLSAIPVMPLKGVGVPLFLSLLAGR